MKKNGLNVVLLLGLIILYILHFTNSPSNNITEEVENIEIPDSLVNDSAKNNTVKILSDSSMLDTLKEAQYSRIGFINMFKVVKECPNLLKDQEELDKRKENLSNRERQLQINQVNYEEEKKKELEKLDANGLLDQATYQTIMNEVGLKRQEAQAELQKLQPKLESIQKFALKVSQKREKIVSDALEILNKKMKLDYVLVEAGTMTNVYPLSDKNDITDLLIKVINNSK